MLDRMRLGALWALVYASTILGCAFIYGPAYAQTTDLIVSWNAVTADTAGVALPAGTVTYRVLQSTNGAEFRQVGEVTQPQFTRRAVPTGTHCFRVVSVFTPSTPDGTEWEPGDQSPPGCNTGPPVRRKAGAVGQPTVERSP
jgi:hypothetical protein